MRTRRKKKSTSTDMQPHPIEISAMQLRRCAADYGAALLYGSPVRLEVNAINALYAAAMAYAGDVMREVRR